MGDTVTTRQQRTRKGLIHGAAASVVLLLVLFAWWPSFNVDFYLDDFRIILENPALQNVYDLQSIWRFSPPRFVASLTFAANYTLHGDSLFGYHLVNLLIHLGSGVALWALLETLLQSPALSATGAARLRWIPLLVAAIFLLHPLQTQAVTYIVQRYASLAALFYLLSMASWARGRLAGRPGWYALAVASMALALFSKQSAATLPLALILLELLFFRRLDARQWSIAIGAGAALAGLTAWLLTLPALDAAGLSRETMAISRTDYLATQMQVLWRYIGLFFLIGEQRLEYDIAIVQGFLRPAVLLYAGGHLLLISTGCLLWRRAPLITFGILFYYLAHAVESGFLPITDLAYEHRTYLPNAGLAVVCAAGLAWLIERWPRRRAGLVMSVVVLALLATATHSRNQLWSDRIAFLTAETRLSPNDQRAWTSLGKELMRAGRFDEALKAMNQAMLVARLVDHGAYRPATLLNQVFALHYTGRQQQALELARKIPLDQLDDAGKSTFYEALGRIHLALGRMEAGERYLRMALQYHANANAAEILARLQAARRSGSLR